MKINGVRETKAYRYGETIGGADLADLGHTASQITEELHFPTPYEKVRQIVWKHYLETAVILLEEPCAG